jgi:hypothetical protein
MSSIQGLDYEVDEVAPQKFDNVSDPIGAIRQPYHLPELNVRFPLPICCNVPLPTEPNFLKVLLLNHFQLSPRSRECASNSDVEAKCVGW